MLDYLKMDELSLYLNKWQQSGLENQRLHKNTSYNECCDSKKNGEKRHLTHSLAYYQYNLYFIYVRCTMNIEHILGIVWDLLKTIENTIA